MRVVLLLLALMGAASAQDLSSPAGMWRTTDDKTGQESGIVRLFLDHGALFGEIVRIFDPARAGLSCIKCDDDRKGHKLIGLQFMRGLKPDGDAWNGGTILDPETGSIYKSSARLTEGGRKLVVRGYLGISLLGRSQTWVREPG